MKRKSNIKYNPNKARSRTFVKKNTVNQVNGTQKYKTKHVT